MSDLLWPEAKAIVAEALECADLERAAFVDARCGNRADLRTEVESLLAAHLRAGSFIDEPFVPDPTIGDVTLPVLTPGTYVGTYRLLKEIGRGGMGTVYLAERADRAFEKHVAIKIEAGHVAAPDLV